VLCVSERPSRKGKLRVPSNADADSRASIDVAARIFDLLCSEGVSAERLSGQLSGSKFEQIVRAFVEETFPRLCSLRPGKWIFPHEARAIARFEQYEHLGELTKVAGSNPELAVLLGADYLIKPDVLVAREPESDEAINAGLMVVDRQTALRTGLRAANNQKPLLHASISCKWTIRSDRAQNSRSEALNLMRSRKGRVPHIMVVTGEPLPSRLASLALGTGDIDCVYHFALPELESAVSEIESEESARLVRIMVEGKRLKDISDLPLDLAV
jgi:hypothetical protein